MVNILESVHVDCLYIHHKKRSLFFSFEVGSREAQAMGALPPQGQDKHRHDWCHALFMLGQASAPPTELLPQALF